MECPKCGEELIIIGIDSRQARTEKFFFCDECEQEWRFRTEHEYQEVSHNVARQYWTDEDGVEYVENNDDSVKCPDCGTSTIPDKSNLKEDYITCGRCRRKSQLAGKDQEELDELVHDFKSVEASDINNSGTEDQIKYLLEAGWGD
jgi:ribosomal protein S27AE